MAKMKRTKQSIQREAEPLVDRSISATDDVNVEHPLEPREEEASVSLRPDPAAGDAGADFADELGRSYLRAATTGEDISEIADEDEMDASEIGGPFLEIEIDAPDETDTDVDIDEDGLRLIGGAVAFAPDERNEPAPLAERSSGESPAEVEQEGEWEWPDEKTPVYRSTAERAGR